MNKTNKWNIRLSKLRWRTRDTTKQSINITFFWCCIATEQSTDRSTRAVHCIAVISFMPLCFRGPSVFIFTYFSFFFVRKCTPFVLFSIFKSRLFYGFCCTSTKSCAYVDVTLVKKHGKIPLFFGYCLFIWIATYFVYWKREKMKIHTTNSNREISFEYREVSRIMTK